MHFFSKHLSESLEVRTGHASLLSEHVVRSLRGAVIFVSVRNICFFGCCLSHVHTCWRKRRAKAALSRVLSVHNLDVRSGVCTDNLVMPSLDCSTQFPVTCGGVTSARDHRAHQHGFTRSDLPRRHCVLLLRSVVILNIISREVNL